jgi:mandelamide amidase
VALEPPFELGVAQAAAAIRAGDLTAQELTEALLARCAEAASLNAFISLEPDRVRAAALRADQQRARGDRLAPLHGVPLVLKDNIDTADFHTTAGTPALAAESRHHCPASSACVRPPCAGRRPGSCRYRTRAIQQVPWHGASPTAH